MTRAQRMMLLVGVLPLLALLAAGATGTVAAIRGKLTYNYSSSFAAGPEGVQITTSDVSTQVLASADDKVHVTVDGSYAAQQPDVRAGLSGRMLVVQTSCPDINCSVNLTVEVPTGTAAIKAKVEGSSIDVDGVSAPMTVSVKDGSFDGARIRSPQTSVDAERGSVGLFFDAPPDSVHATAISGSITVQLPRSTTYKIDAVAAQGSTDLAVPNDMTATHQVHLRTSYGSITVQ
ncbi:hypothetical protein [Kribbella sp.]|uniref:hypothetical protein n=1 Tax=Kribbella sp. TaxID=1871183 RepID=UPI002D43274D|nr:hypothetical protein [Kribbella sp.]HZX03815.1 hypothetical protein [Kribbella sp.]